MDLAEGILEMVRRISDECRPTRVAYPPKWDCSDRTPPVEQVASVEEAGADCLDPQTGFRKRKPWNHLLNRFYHRRMMGIGV